MFFTMEDGELSFFPVPKEITQLFLEIYTFERTKPTFLLIPTTVGSQRQRFHTFYSKCCKIVRPFGLGEKIQCSCYNKCVMQRWNRFSTVDLASS